MQKKNIKKKVGRVIILLSIICSISVLRAQTGFDYNWSKSYGSKNYDIVRDIVVDAEKNVYVIGGFQDTIDLDPGPGVIMANVAFPGQESAFIEKLDSSGHLVWVKTFMAYAPTQSGGYSSLASGMHISLVNNTYLVANLQIFGKVDMDPGPGVNDYFNTGVSQCFFTMDLGGNLGSWISVLPTTSTANMFQLIEMTTNPAGEIFIGGSISGTVDMDPGSSTQNFSSSIVNYNDILIAKYTPTGDFVFCSKLRRTATSGPAFTPISDITIDNLNNIYVTGYFSGTIDFNPGTGNFLLTSNGYNDTYLCKLTNTGTFSYAMKTSSPSTSSGSSPTSIEYANNNLYLIGGYYGTVDFDMTAGTSNLSSTNTIPFMAKYTSGGNLVYTKTLNTNTDNNALTALKYYNGNLYLAGYITDTVDVDPGPSIHNLSPHGIWEDVFIARYDTSGNYSSAISVGNEIDYLFGLDVKGNQVFTAGYFSDTLDADPSTAIHPLESSGAQDGMILSYKLCSMVPVIPTGINGNITVCTGSSQTYSVFPVSDAASYTWTLPSGWSGTSTTNSISITAGTSGGNISVIANNACGNSSPQTLAVSVSIPVVTANATDNNLCNGESTILTGGGASSYTWTGGVINGISFTPSSTTTYTVTGTDVNSCTNTNTITITVNNLPNITANATDTNLCSGESTILTGGGTSSYTWTGGITNGVSFIPSATTTYTVTGTDINSCTNTNTITITVNILPSVIANAVDNNLCNGESTILTGSGATSYTWTGGVSNGVSFIPSATATYTVTGTDVNTCSNTATITVTVNNLPSVTANATDNNLCNGESTILIGSGANSYIWSGGVNDGVSFVPSTTTTYTVTGTDVNSCSNTNTITITVNNLPIVTANATDNNLCNGEPTILTGGGASSYTWTGGVNDGFSFIPSLTATYTVTGTDVNSCSNTNTIIITVNNLPMVTANATENNLCNGESTTLTGGGASSYTWTGGVNNGVAFTPSSTATYTVTGTDVNSCSNTNTITVTVNNLPIVSANATDDILCNGESTILTGGGASSYTWTGGVNDGVFFVPSSTATYTVTGTDANSCTNTNTIIITVNNLPTVSFNYLGTDTVCTSYGIQILSGGSPAGGAYNGTGVSGVNFDPNIAGIGSHTITYLFTDVNSCSNTASVDIVVLGCADIENNFNSSINIYPNPFTNSITINGIEENTKVSLYNSLGEAVGNWIITKNNFTIITENFCPGVYFLEIGKTIKKIIKW